MGVTAVIATLFPSFNDNKEDIKAALAHKRSTTVEEIEKEWVAAADKGTAHHLSIENDLRAGTVSKESHPYLKLLAKLRPVNLTHIEKYVVSKKYNLTGICDLIFQGVDRGRIINILVDWKSTPCDKLENSFSDTSYDGKISLTRLEKGFLQLYMYKLILQEHNINIEKMYIINGEKIYLYNLEREVEEWIEEYLNSNGKS